MDEWPQRCCPGAVSGCSCGDPTWLAVDRRAGFMVLLCSAPCVTCAPHPPPTFSGPLFALSKPELGNLRVLSSSKNSMSLIPVSEAAFEPPGPPEVVCTMKRADSSLNPCSAPYKLHGIGSPLVYEPLDLSFLICKRGGHTTSHKGTCMMDPAGPFPMASPDPQPPLPSFPAQLPLTHLSSPTSMLWHLPPTCLPSPLLSHTPTL